MASTSEPRNWRKVALSTLSKSLYTIAIVAGFAAMYPAYSAHNQVEGTQYVVTPTSSMLIIVIALLLVGMAYVSGKSHEHLERKMRMNN